MRHRLVFASLALALLVAPAALASPREERLRVGALDLPGYGAADLELARFDLLAPDFTFHLDGRPAALPASLRGAQFYRGRVAGEPDSLAVLRLSGDGSVGGAVELRGERWALGAAGGALAAEAELFDEPPALEDEQVLRGERARYVAPAARRPGPVPLPVGVYGARILVESDYEFFLLSRSSVEHTTDRLLSLFAAVSAVLEKEIGVRLLIGRLTVWQTPDDPWWNGDDYGRLGWQTYVAHHPVRSDPRAFVYLLTGRRDGGGVLAGVCTGYGPQPQDLGWSWGDQRTVAHEIGHIFGSEHTHCYGPPIDKCATEAPAHCYKGPTERRAANDGSLMSYCLATSLSYGASGRYGDRSERVPATMRATTERAAASYRGCLTPLTDALNLRVESTTATSATLVWNDVFADETGWILEELRSKKWRAVRQAPANATRLELANLTAGRAATYRLFARFKKNVSQPSVPVTVLPRGD